MVSDFVVNVVSDFAQWNGCLIQQLSNAIIMHVEVQDYGIACIARVSSLSQKFLVIGMLGDWWVLYSSSSSISGFSIGSWFPVLPSDYWWRMQIKKEKTWKRLYDCWKYTKLPCIAWTINKRHEMSKTTQNNYILHHSYCKNIWVVQGRKGLEFFVPPEGFF